MADNEQQTEPNTVADLLDEIEDEKLYQALLTVDKHTLFILLLKMRVPKSLDERIIEKEENALEWTRQLNNIRACAREIVNEEIIYA